MLTSGDAERALTISNMEGDGEINGVNKVSTGGTAPTGVTVGIHASTMALFILAEITPWALVNTTDMEGAESFQKAKISSRVWHMCLTNMKMGLSSYAKVDAP